MRLPTLHSETLRLETELSSLERLGILVDAPPPYYEAIEGTESERMVLRASGLAAMHSGIILVYLREFEVEVPEKGQALVAAERRSYSAVLRGFGSIARLDSGHISHSQTPHVHTAWPDSVGLDPPEIPISAPVELGNFVMRIERWRVENVHALPHHPGSIEDVRIP